jgi:citronellyl-CoA synthetase
MRALDVIRDLETLLGGRTQALSFVRSLPRKLPAVARGLRLTNKTDRNEVLSIGTYLERNARTWPDRTALMFEDRRYTHRQLDEEANRWAHVLAARGIGKGDVVALYVDNRPELLLAVAGIVKLGAIAAMINSRQHGRALEHSFKVAKAAAFVIGEELWDAYAEVKGAVDVPACVFWLADRGEREVPAGVTDAGAELARARTTSLLGGVRLGDPAFYIYTSGTTGLPKASIMSHFRWVKAAGGFGIAALQLEPDDVLYVALPLYHSNALVVAWSAAAATGAALALRRKFSVTSFWDDVRRYRATAFIYIGELCRYLMNQPPSRDDRRHAVRKIVGNGLRPDIWRAFKERFGIEEVYEFYSASEANIAFVNLLNAECTVGLCPAPYALVRYDVDRDEPVRGADGRLLRVSRGEVGLLISKVSARYAFDGYTDPAANEKKLLRDVFEPGDCWFNSGDLLRDLGFRHAQFVDRVGDTFRWKGENVSTTEVGATVCSFPDVAEAAVYGVTVPGSEGRAGMVAAVIYRNFDLDAFRQYLVERLPEYARPLFLRLPGKIDVTGTFKSKKQDLAREGYDPTATADAIYFNDPLQHAFVKIDLAMYESIKSGKLRL